jgi:ATP-dependent Clp protease ATP-binding subunit ClpC
VVLLDEIEKAHPDVFNILLQVLDDGILTDGLGRRVDFRNTIVIMTSNIGARDIKNLGKGIGFAVSEGTFDYAKMKSTVEDALKRVFNPEFLNRVDDVIVFHPLEKSHVFEIIEIMQRDLFKRVEDLGIEVELSTAAKEFLVEKGYDPAYGARPLRRAIQKYVEDPMAEAILTADLSAGAKMTVDHKKGEELLSFKTRKATRARAAAAVAPAPTPAATEPAPEPAPAAEPAPDAERPEEAGLDS